MVKQRRSAATQGNGGARQSDGKAGRGDAGQGRGYAKRIRAEHCIATARRGTVELRQAMEQQSVGTYRMVKQRRGVATRRPATPSNGVAGLSVAGLSAAKHSNGEAWRSKVAQSKGGVLHRVVLL